MKTSTFANLLKFPAVFCCVILLFNVALAEDLPLNQTDADKGEITPASFIKGHVTHQVGKYILGPDDVIEIKVKDLSQYDQKFTIRPDGMASVHPFGEYHIAGIDVEGLQLWLKERFKYYLLKPEVTVTVVEMRPALVYVLGAVMRPGTYQFTRRVDQTSELDLTLTNVISKASIRENADLANVKVIHAVTQEQETYNLIDFLTLGKGTDVVLMPGDKVVIPELPGPMDPKLFGQISRSTFFKEKFPVVVLGSVQHQGEVEVSVNNNTLNAALGLAGGFLPTARKSGIVVQRPDQNGHFQKMVIRRQDDQFALLPGDIVYVGNTKLASIEHLLKVMGAVGSTFFYGVNGTLGIKNIQQLNRIDNQAQTTVINTNDNSD